MSPEVKKSSEQKYVKWKKVFKIKHNVTRLVACGIVRDWV